MSWIRNRIFETSARLLLAAVFGVVVFGIDQSPCSAQSHPIQKLRPTKGIIDQLMDAHENGNVIDAPDSTTKLFRQMQFDASEQQNDQVKHAYYDDAGPGQLKEVSRESWNDESDGYSFIEKERAASKTKQQSDQEGPKQLATRLAINLMLVLALAVTAILGVKHWQKTKNATPTGTSDGTALRIETTLPLPNGSSLHVVEVSQSKFLVAIDATGIKSIESLANGFQETMSRVETQTPPATVPEAPAAEAEVKILSQRMRATSDRGTESQPKPAPKPVPKPKSKSKAQPKRKPAPEPNEEFDPNEDTEDIDAKLIKLLLRRSNQAA